MSKIMKEDKNICYVCEGQIMSEEDLVICENCNHIYHKICWQEIREECIHCKNKICKEKLNNER